MKGNERKIQKVSLPRRYMPERPIPVPGTMDIARCVGATKRSKDVPLFKVRPPPG